MKKHVANDNLEPGPENFQWRITPHVCRICFARVLARTAFDGKRIYRCSNCGVEREGSDTRAICCCGIKLKTGIDAGVRCVANDNRSPECPGEIVAMQVDKPSL